MTLKNAQVAEYLEIAVDKLTRKINNEGNRLIKDILKTELQQLQAHIVWLKGLPEDTKTK